MPEVGLQRARIVPGVSQGEAASVAKHVGVDLNIEAGSSPDTLDHLGKAGRGEWRTALAHEHER